MNRRIPHFYSSKSLILTTAFVAIGFVLSNLMYLRKPHVSAPVSTVESSSHASQDAIKLAQDYFAGRYVQVQTSQKLVLDFLYRKYGISEQFNADVNYVVNKEPDRAVSAELDALMRIAYPDNVVTSLGSNPSIVAMAANCDHIPVPNDFTDRLNIEVQKGGYEATHVALALQVMQDLGCSTVSDSGKLLEASISAMKTNIESTNSSNDLRYESIAFLYMLNKYDQIQASWIEQIISEQNRDGGWRFNKTSSDSDEHATLLALWALLGYVNPDAPYEPIIHKLRAG